MRDLIRWIPRYMMLNRFLQTILRYTVRERADNVIFSALPDMTFVASIQIRKGYWYPLIVARSGSFMVDWFLFQSLSRTLYSYGKLLRGSEELEISFSLIVKDKGGCLKCWTLTWYETSVLTSVIYVRYSFATGIRPFKHTRHTLDHSPTLAVCVAEKMSLLYVYGNFGMGSLIFNKACQNIYGTENSKHKGYIQFKLYYLSH